MFVDVVACQSLSIDRRFDQIRSGGTSIGGGHGMIDGEEISDDEHTYTHFAYIKIHRKMSMMLIIIIYIYIYIYILFFVLLASLGLGCAGSS